MHNQQGQVKRGGKRIFYKNKSLRNFFLFIWEKFSEQGDVIRKSLNTWIGKLEYDTVAFFFELTIDCIHFPKSTHPIFIIVAMLTAASFSNKDLFYDMGAYFQYMLDADQQH